MNISNGTGYDNIGISIKIDDIPPQIVYDIENITLVRIGLLTIIPSHQNGTIEFVQSSHSLPSGLAVIKVIWRGRYFISGIINVLFYQAHFGVGAVVLHN